MLASVAASEAEKATARPGDGLIQPADVVMDRAFTIQAPPPAVWPWLVQLGKKRAGWYLTGAIERFLPRSGRAARVLDPGWLHLEAGDVIPDYGGRTATFQVAQITPPNALVGSQACALRCASAMSPVGETAMPHGVACLMIATQALSWSCAARQAASAST